MNHLANLDNDVDRFMQSFLQPGSGAGVLAPAVDIVETGNDIRVSVELPGVSKDDVNVGFHDGSLIIKGEKKDLSVTEGENLRRSERRHGTFQRKFEIGMPVNSQEIKARFKDGVLTVTLPKTEEAKPREISIEH